MDYDVVEARYIRDYIVWLKFRDGTQGEINLAPAMWGPVFEPHRDRSTSAGLRWTPSSTR